MGDQTFAALGGDQLERRRTRRPASPRESEIGIGNTSILRRGKWQAKITATPITPPDAPITARPASRGEVNNLVEQPRHDNQAEVQPKEFPFTVHPFHIAAKYEQAEHVEHKVPNVERIVQKAVGQKLPEIPRMMEQIGLQARNSRSASFVW